MINTSKYTRHFFPIANPEMRWAKKLILKKHRNGVR